VYEAAPTVTGLSPSSGSANGGNTITVTGTGFLAVQKVTFGGVAGTNVTVQNATQLTVVTPAHATGTADQQVTNLRGTSAAASSDKYSYTPAPVTQIKASASATAVVISWSNPNFPGFAGVVIRRATGATPPSGPTKGTAVTSTGATATSYTDKGLTAATTYSYALFAHDSAGNYAPAATVTLAAAPNLIDVSGTLTHNATWSPTAATAYIVTGTLDIPAGVTLTIDPGTVVKALNTKLTVGGSLVASGTAASPVVFTSVNDGSAGGATGSGSPRPGDWNGIASYGSGSVDIEHAVVSYATNAVDFDADPISNDAVHNDWFHDNTVAISASSTWTTISASALSCFYLPTIDVSRNEYGPGKSSDPIVSAGDYATIEAALLLPHTEEFPDGWADNLQIGSSDTFSWSVEPCVNVTDPSESYVAVATPLNFSGDQIIPIGGAPSHDVRSAEQA